MIWLNRNPPRWPEWWMQMIIAYLWHSGNAMGGLLIILIQCSMKSRFCYAFYCNGFWIAAISTGSGWLGIVGQGFYVNTSINDYLCHLFNHLLLWNQCFTNIILCAFDDLMLIETNALWNICQKVNHDVRVNLWSRSGAYPVAIRFSLQLLSNRERHPPTVFAASAIIYLMNNYYKMIICCTVH